MYCHRTPRALLRAQWFSEMSLALSEAEKLLGIMEAGGSFLAETTGLRSRIQTVKSELAMLDRVILSEQRVVGAWPDLTPASARPLDADR